MQIFINIVLIIIILYQHSHIKTHIIFDTSFTEVLEISPINIIELYVGGKTIPLITDNLYKITKIDFKRYKRFMARNLVEKVIINYINECNVKGVDVR